MGFCLVCTATILASTLIAAAWMGGMPALDARSIERARKPWMMSGPAERLGQSVTWNGSLPISPEAWSATCVGWMAMLSLVSGGTVVGRGAAAARPSPAAAPQPARPSVVAPRRPVSRVRRWTVGMVMVLTYNTYRLNRLYKPFKEVDVTTLVVSGNPRPGSRTLKLAVAVGEALSATPISVIDVGELGAGLLTKGHEGTAAAVAALHEASLLVIATPTYKGSYTGILKVLLDNLPAAALAGRTAVPVVTAGIQPQADA